MRTLCLFLAMLGTAVNLDGTAYLVASHLTGSETVTSFGGTSSVSVSSGRIDLSAGTLWDLQLSDGTRYPIAERAGIKVHDVSGGGNHAYFEAPPANLWRTPDNDHLWELDHGANPALYCDGSGSLEVSTPSINLSTFSFAARVTTAKPAFGLIAEYQESDTTYSIAEHAMTGLDLRTSWQWVVQTFDGTTGTLYANDSAGSTVAATGSTLTFSSKWFSGLGSSENPFLLGRVLIFNRVFTSGERTALFSANTIPASGKVLDYNFSDSTADPVKDWSGAGNAGSGMASMSLVNVPALAANNGVDAMGNTVLNPSFTRSAIAHSADFPSYEEALSLRGNSGDVRWFAVRSRNFEDGKKPSPESVRIIKQIF